MGEKRVFAFLIASIIYFGGSDVFLLSRNFGHAHNGSK